MTPSASCFFTVCGFATVLFVDTALAAPSKIQVLSATVKDQVIPGAQVLLQKNGETTTTGVTGVDGQFSNTAGGVSATDPAATLIIRKSGYSTLVAKCPCNNLTYAISPIMQQLDGMRIVLNWGESPQDVDAHLSYPGNHIFFQSKDGADAKLDVDDVDGFGPETVTIDRKHPGERYVYAVHSYQDRAERGTTDLERNPTRVLVYVGQTLVRSYYVDPTKAGNLWTVFAISAEGDFEDINEYSDANDPSDILGTRVSRQLDTTSQVNVSATDRSRSAELNRQGETAYHAKDFDSAIRLFQQAIELQPDYGQAYSNLGLTFEKAGNEAEAIWANRKAIALASGADAARVRASSHYNIARMYEAKSQWSEALRSFQKAEAEKHNDAYTRGISRMQAKLR